MFKCFSFSHNNSYYLHRLTLSCVCMTAAKQETGRHAIFTRTRLPEVGIGFMLCKIIFNCYITMPQEPKFRVFKSVWGWYRSGRSPKYRSFRKELKCGSGDFKACQRTLILKQIGPWTIFFSELTGLWYFSSNLDGFWGVGLVTSLCFLAGN